MFTSRFPLLVALALPLAGTGAARAADVDPLVPPDTQSYLTVNVRSILAAPLFKNQLLVPLKNLLAESPEVKGVLDDLGFDPLRDLDRVLFASPGGAEPDRGLAIVHGAFDEAKFKKRADDAARDDGAALKVHKVALGGGATHTVWEVALPGQDASLFVALATNKVLLASPGKDYVVDALKQHRAGKKAVLESKTFQALVEKLDPRQSVSLALLGKPLAAAAQDGLPKGLAASLRKVEAVGGGLTVTNEVKLDLLVASKNAAAADTIRDSLDRGVKLGMVGLALLTEGRKDLGLVLEVVKTIKVGGKGKVVSVSARLTADVLEDFFKKEE